MTEFWHLQAEKSRRKGFPQRNSYCCSCLLKATGLERLTWYHPCCSRQQHHIALYKPVVLLLNSILAVFTAPFRQQLQNFPPLMVKIHLIFKANFLTSCSCTNIVFLLKKTFSSSLVYLSPLYLYRAVISPLGFHLSRLNKLFNLLL